MSASDILSKMLSAMPESYQKTIGFPTYDLLAAVSLRMEGTDTTIDEAKQQLDPENLHDSALDRYIYPRSGLERKAATFAHGSLTVTGTGTVEQGTLFESGGGVQYYATETVAIEGEGTVPGHLHGGRYGRQSARAQRDADAGGSAGHCLVR